MLLIAFFIIYSISVIMCYNVIDILYGSSSSSDDFCFKKIIALFIIHIPILNTMIALGYLAWVDEEEI